MTRGRARRLTLARFLAGAALSVVVCTPIAAQSDSDSAEKEADIEEATEEPQQKRTPNFGGPNQVDNQIRLDDEEKPLLQHWADWNVELGYNKGFSFGIDYSPVYLGADDSP